MPEFPRSPEAPRTSLHEPPATVTAEGVEAHPRRVGHRWADAIIAGAAILLSVLSLFIALKHGEIMKDLVAANSWPLLQAVTGNADDNKPVIKMSVQNVGNGPAIIKTFHATYKGQRFTEGERFVDACCGSVSRLPNGQFAPGDTMTNFIGRSVIRSGEDSLFLGLERVSRSEAVWQRLNKARFEVRYFACYCSVLGQCWESDLTGIDPKPVRECQPE